MAVVLTADVLCISVTGSAISWHNALVLSSQFLYFNS